MGKRRHVWTGERLALSNGIVENITGHRTRVAQQPPDEHHAREDAMLARYQ